MKKAIFILLLAGAAFAARGPGGFGGKHHGSWHGRGHGTVAQPVPDTATFVIDADDSDVSGPSALPLTLGGTTADLALACDMDDVSGTTLTCTSTGGAITMTEVGAGTSPAAVTPLPFTDPLAGARYFTGSGKNYEASANGNGEVGTDDFAVSAIFYAGTTAATPTSVGLLGQNPGITTEMRIWVGSQRAPSVEP